MWPHASQELLVLQQGSLHHKGGEPGGAMAALRTVTS